MILSLLEQIDAHHPLVPLDIGAWRRVKVNGMTFSIRAYHADGLGRVSVMTASGMLGLMKMETLIVNPTEKDLPLYSYDRIRALGNDTLIIELYDTQLAPVHTRPLSVAKALYARLPERDPGVHWYDAMKLPESVSKKGKTADTHALSRLASDFTAAYLRLNGESVAEPGAKRAKAAVYVDGLLEKGGPATDPFLKALGPKATAELFRTVLFDTAAAEETAE
ncbi:MAG: hypothetical protein IJY28_06245 [Clostridia bacterium]|nr:hypothetical protein [Clostridia bacterium]